jgi:hypothetical protein
MMKREVRPPDRRRPHDAVISGLHGGRTPGAPPLPRRTRGEPRRPRGRLRYNTRSYGDRARMTLAQLASGKIRRRLLRDGQYSEIAP